MLQTTSYHFTQTGTIPEICAGVVKPLPIHSKNPGQHAADFAMLMEKEELHAAFHLPDGKPKSILCARMDGAMDKGPSYEEVQFFWTLDHLKMKEYNCYFDYGSQQRIKLPQQSRVTKWLFNKRPCKFVYTLHSGR